MGRFTDALHFGVTVCRGRDVEICWLHSTVHRIIRAQICTSLRRRFTDVLHFGVTVCRYKRSPKFAVTNILSEYCHKVWYKKTRMVWLPEGGKSLRICLLVSTQYTNVTDTQMDGRTDAVWRMTSYRRQKERKCALCDTLLRHRARH